MKRKQYILPGERIVDRKRGAALFCVSNLLIFGIYKWAQYQITSNASTFQLGELTPYLRYIELLPWLANGALLLASAIFWKEVAVGYLSCFGTIIGTVIAIGVLAYVSCFVSLPVMILGEPPAILVFIILFFAGIYWIFPYIRAFIKDIWDV